MAYGKVRVKTVPTVSGTSYPGSLTAPWLDVILAGGLTTQDGATITNPETGINASATVTKLVIPANGAGTNLILRMKYDSTLTAITSPIVKVFGRTGSDAWQLLYSRAGNLVETITADTTNDARDGTFNYTTPAFGTHAWDRLGCDELIVGVQTILAGSTGSVATATLQAKII